VGQSTDEYRVSCVSVIAPVLRTLIPPSSMDISHARCISLACYSVQDLEPYTNQKGGKRENWFENVRPVPWPKMPRHLWFLVNDEFTILYPPYEVGQYLLFLLRYQAN
jgi:hypothetical protein